jgi:predicted alpha/beta-fold hydrolase
MKAEHFVPARVQFPAAANAVLVGEGQPSAHNPGTRQWLRATHDQIEHVLPERGRRVLLTEDMVGTDGRPLDVYAYFDRPVWTLNKLNKNWNGMVHTGQAVSRDEAIDTPVSPWPGFRTVWISVAEGVNLHGRLGLALGRDGQPVDADCIVLIPGFLGDNAVLRTRDLAFGLLSRGFHVLALELRGHGRVEYYYPDLYYNFGVTETQDLLRVSEWLQDKHPFIRNTGLIGFCWGGNHAMLAAWYDGRRPDDPSISPRLAAHLDLPSGRKHYTAGVMAFSPVLRWEELMERADTPHEDMWQDPSMYFFQQVIKGRMRRKGYPEVSGSLRRLINYEFARSEFGPSLPITDGYQFLRFLPHRGQPDGDKLESTRIPVLMVTSVNDPFLSAQDMADITARTDNPLVASLILRGGGHIGFGPYNPSYFYSLILNYFDPVNGAAAVCGARDESAPLVNRAYTD